MLVYWVFTSPECVVAGPACLVHSSRMIAESSFIGHVQAVDRRCARRWRGGVPLDCPILQDPCPMLLGTSTRKDGSTRVIAMAQLDQAHPLAMTSSTSDIAQSIAAMRPLFDRHASEDGFIPTPIPGLQLIRSSEPYEPLNTTYRPSLCLLLSGRKRLFLRDQVTEYGSHCHLVTSQDLPILGQVVEATPSDPYRCIYFRIEQAEVGQIALDHGMPQEPPGATADAARGLYTEPTSTTLANAILRLLQLLDAPADIPAIAPLIRREIVYRLMSSPNGWRVARTVKADCADQRIARVIAVLRSRFREPIGVSELASIAHLSPSALHFHFKNVTSLTPLQYVKQLRLQEARRLLVSLDMDASTIGFEVGYESPSQFNREYARMFGAPPMRDKSRLLKARSLGAKFTTQAMAHA